jgi:hypothetical protein
MLLQYFPMIVHDLRIGTHRSDIGAK